MPKTVDATLKLVKESLSEYAWANQPMYHALMNEKLNNKQLQYFAMQWSVFPLHNHHYHGNLYVHCPNAAWRRRIAEVVYEEGTGRLFANDLEHSQLWYLFSDAVGVSREQMATFQFCPGALAMRVYFEWICCRTFLEGVSAHMLAGEAQVPGVMGKIARNLQKQNGLSTETVSFFDVHEVADEDHSSVGYDLLADFAKSEADFDLVIRTVRDYLGIERLMNDDIYRGMQRLA
jgi:pyrroloquinoline-quinone synthase